MKVLGLPLILFCISNISYSNCRQSLFCIISLRLQLYKYINHLTLVFQLTLFIPLVQQTQPLCTTEWPYVPLSLSLCICGHFPVCCFDVVSSALRHLRSTQSPPLSPIPSAHSLWPRICSLPTGNTARFYPYKWIYPILDASVDPLSLYLWGDLSWPGKVQGRVGDRLRGSWATLDNRWLPNTREIRIKVVTGFGPSSVRMF